MYKKCPFYLIHKNIIIFNKKQIYASLNILFGYIPEFPIKRYKKKQDTIKGGNTP